MFTDWLRNWLRYREQVCISTSVDGVMYEASEYSKRSSYKTTSDLELSPFPRIPPPPQFALECDRVSRTARTYRIACLVASTRRTVKVEETTYYSGTDLLPGLYVDDVSALSQVPRH